MTVRKLASDFMCSPIRITVGADELTANARVEQTVVVLQDGREKEQRLLGVLRDHGFTKGGVKKGGGVGRDREKCLVFALYKKEATRVAEFLERQGFEVGCIQGDMSQDKRSQSLENFKDGRVQLLVATGESSMSFPFDHSLTRFIRIRCCCSWTRYPQSRTRRESNVSLDHRRCTSCATLSPSVNS